MKRHLVGVSAALLGTMLMGGVVAQTASAAVPAESTVTLPLFGVPLTIDITTGPGGALTDVAVNPADGSVPTSASPRKVVFERTDATTGATGKVTIKSKHGGQSVSARGGSLADVTGDGGWSGDLFGDGVISTVTFAVAAAADGGPDIVGTSAGGADNEIGPVQYSTGDDDDDETSASARQTITFTNAAGDQKRTIKISVRVKTDEDGDTSAKLSISLGRLKGVAIAADLAAGPHTWSGLLCDGTTTATITYTVNADGSVQDVVATPAADVRTDDSKIDVRFSDNERVRIKVRENDGQIKISVDEKIRCDSADPTFNGAAVPTTVDEGGDDNHDGDHHDGDHKDGGHGDDDDGTTTTTVA
ncbi:MAG: hypothetical protein QOJ08_1014 [Ilumatobacteraceae bacterium]